MSDEYQQNSRYIEQERQRFAATAGPHYRKLAGTLRALALECRLPNPQRELLSLARRYDRTAAHLDRSKLQSSSVGEQGLLGPHPPFAILEGGKPT